MNNEFDNPYLDDPIQDEFNKEAAKNPYIQDEIVEQQEQRAVYNLSVDQGAQIQPERSAEVLKISREKNVPAFFVEKNYDSFAKEKHRKTYDYNEMSKKNPYLTEWVKDPVRASLANDELDKLKEVETRSRLLTFKHQDMTLGNAIKAGIKSNYINLEKSYYLAKLLNGIGDPDETANTIAEMNIALAKREEKLPQHYKDFREEYGKASATYSKTAKERKEIWEKNWEGDVLGNLADYLEKGGESASDLFDMLALMGKNPKSGAISASQSLINSFAPLIVGVGVSSAAAPITTAVGTTVGGAAGTLLPIPGGAATGAATGASLAGGATFLAASTATGVALETMLELEGFLADSGVDMANPESIKAAFNDEKLIKEMRGKALKKGLTTAVVDSLASLIGGKLIGKAKPTITGKIVGGVKAAGIEAVGEGAGEAAGRFAATGEADVGEALEEGWSSIFIGGGMGSVGYVYAKGKNLSRSLAQNPVKAAMQIKEMNDRVGEARQHAQGVDSLIEIVQESKLNSRDRDSMVELVGGSTEGASVYFQSDDWEAHWGDDAISKADELLPKGRGDLEKAKTEGSLIKVPLADYVTKFPEETSFAELNKLMRRDSESLSLQQAETIGANIPSLLKEVAKEARKEIQKRKQESDARKAVQDSVEGQLISQGIDSKEAKSLAKLRAAQVNTLAGIRGVSAIAQEAVRPLDIQAFTSEEFTEFQKEDVVFQEERRQSVKEEIESVTGETLDIEIDDSGSPYIRDEFEKIDILEEVPDITYTPEDMVQQSMPTGERRTRAEAAGFNVDNMFFHGSRGVIDAFSSETLGSSTGAGSAKMAHFFASSPTLASDYAKASNTRKTLEIERRWGQNEKEIELFKKQKRDKYGPKWVSKLTKEEKAKRSELNKEKKDIISLQEEQITKTSNYSSFIDTDIKRTKEQIEEVNRLIKEGDQDDVKRYREIILEYESMLAKDVSSEKIDRYRYLYKDAKGDVIVNSRTNEDGRTFYSPAQIEIKLKKAKTYVKNRTDKKKLRVDLKNLQKELEILEDTKRYNETENLGEVVYPVYLKMRNPMIVDFKGAPYREVTYRELLEKAKERGHDSVVFKNTFDPAFIGAGLINELVDVAAVFEGNQVRSSNAEFKDIKSDDLLAQKDDKKFRGFLDISKQDRLLLGILEHRNKSTILHEFGHVFLEDVKTLYSDIKDGAKNETQKRFLADVETIKKELGVESLDDIQTEHHEKFARLFESYLLEGKAPSKELTSVFHRFKTWLINLYKNVKGVKEASGLDFNLTPDMREAFDRMLATEEEIAEASGEMGFDENQLSDYFDLITTNKEEKERLELAHREAQDEAFLELYRKQVAQMKKKKTAEYKSRKAVLKEQFTKIADETPLYIAQDAIKFHVLNGQEITSHETLKFNTDELKNYLTKEQLKKFPRSLYSKSGISPEVTATMLGFKSGKELVDLIVKNPDKKTFIEESTQIELNKEFPDYLDPNRDDELKADAIDSVNNDMRDKALRLELDLMIKNSPSEIKKLIKKNIKRLPTSKEVRREADNRIDDTLISEAKPHIFTRVENKARRESGQHMLNGQFEKLAKAKVSEMLNYQLSRSANEAQQLIDKTIKKNNKRLAVSDEKLRKKGNVDMYKVAQSILAKYGMLPDTRVESLSSYMKKLKDYNPEIHSMVDGLSSALVDIPATGNYSELTVGQFKEITEIVDALYNLSEKEKFVRVDGKKVDIDVAVSELAASIQDTGRKAVKKFDTGYKKFQGLLSSFYANNTRVEHFINWLDKNDPEGPWSRYVWNRINDAQTEYLQLREETTDKLNQILKNNFKGIFKDKTQIDLTKYFSNVDPDVAMIKKPELVMMLLHSGNDSNKRKLLLGRKLGAENLDGTLNTVEFDNFIKEMINEGHIDKTIMDGVQAIWDLYEALKPGLQKAYKDSFGTYFKEIEANPFSTPWGEYRGGYAPATTDSLLVEAEAERQDAVSIEAERNQFDYAATPKGMTKERIAAYNKALSLDFGITLAQMEKTVRFTTLQSAIGDVNRIINHRELSDVMFKADNNWNKGILKPWLARAATQRTAPVYSDYYTREAAKMTGFLRRSTNQAIMALNIKNTVENLTDITALFVHMDKKSWMEGVKQYSAQPREVTQMIMELDPSMKDRFSNNLYEVQDMYRDLVLNGTLLDDVAKWQKTASKYSYITQRTLQNFMEASAWIGAYNEGLVKFKDSPDPSKKAARNASRIIRLVMGSNRAIDIANVEAVSEFAKVFITFFSYFNNRANLIGYSTKDKRAKAIRLGWLAPAIIAELLRRVVWKGNIGDEEDEELVNYVDDGFEIFLGAPLEFALAAGSPTIRNGSRIIIGQFTKQQYDDRLSMSPLLGSVEAMKGVTNLIVKDKATGKDVRDALQFTSTVTGFPLNPLGKPVGFMLDLDQGKQKAENPIDYFRGITTGRSGKR